MLCHSCILRGPQQRGIKSEVATPPLPSGGAKRGRKCYVTLALLGVPNEKEQNEMWQPHFCLLGGPKEGRNAMETLHSRGSPTPSTGSKIRSGPQQGGTKSEVATSPVPSPGPKRGRICYVTLAFSGVLNKGEQSQKWLPHFCLLGGPKEGENATAPLVSWGSPTPITACKIRGGPNKGEQNQNWLSHPCLLGGPKEGRNATQPLHSRGSPKRALMPHATFAASTSRTS